MRLWIAALLVALLAASQAWAAPETVRTRNAQGAERQFQIEHELARGAHGAVYLGHAVGSGEQVVIKRAHAGCGAPCADILRNEAAVFEKISGVPQLPRSYGFGHDDRGTPALVIEHVRGQRLDVLAKRPEIRHQPGKVVRIGMQLLRAVRALNTHGLRHGDLHAGNALIEGDASATVKVIDLGMARPLSTPYPWGGPWYYAPEQTAAKASQGRANADVYSVAALMTHLLTGGEPSQAALQSIPEVAVTINDQVVRLRDVLHRALDPDPATRYQTAQELLDALRPFSQGP